jgi:hypothetical protein
MDEMKPSNPNNPGAGTTIPVTPDRPPGQGPNPAPAPGGPGRVYTPHRGSDDAGRPMGR